MKCRGRSLEDNDSKFLNRFSNTHRHLVSEIKMAFEQANEAQKRVPYEIELNVFEGKGLDTKQGSGVVLCIAELAGEGGQSDEVENTSDTVSWNTTFRFEHLTPQQFHHKDAIKIKIKAKEKGQGKEKTIARCLLPLQDLSSFTRGRHWLPLSPAGMSHSSVVMKLRRQNEEGKHD